MGFFDDLKDASASLRDTASDVSQIRSDWKETQQIYSGYGGYSSTGIPVQQATTPAQVAQQQGNVATASQWNMLPAGGSSGLIVAAVVVAAGLLLMRRG